MIWGWESSWRITEIFPQITEIFVLRKYLPLCNRTGSSSGSFHLPFKRVLFMQFGMFHIQLIIKKKKKKSVSHLEFQPCFMLYTVVLILVHFEDALGWNRTLELRACCMKARVHQQSPAYSPKSRLNWTEDVVSTAWSPMVFQADNDLRSWSTTARC